MNSTVPGIEDYKISRVEEVEKFFDQPQNYLGRNGYDIRVRAETAAQFLRDRDFTSILDIGCGDGSVSLPLLTAQRDLTLLDVSSHMLAVAQSRIAPELRERVKVLNVDFLQASLNGKLYDVVICIGVLAHVSSPDAVLSKIAGILKPGGVLILQSTDSSHFLRRFVDLYHRVIRLMRPGLYLAAPLTRQQILDMLAKYGLAVKAKFCYSSGLPGLHRFLSQEALYRTVRRVFGDFDDNRCVWMGSETISVIQHRLK